MKQLDLFPDMSTVLEFKPKNLRHCKDCKHLLAVRFQSNLFFCTKQIGGQYGKKIKKSNTVIGCPLFIKDTGPITNICGYYGHEFQKGVSR